MWTITRVSSRTLLKHLAWPGLLVCLLVLASFHSGFGQYRTDMRLQRKLERLIAPFHGQVGLYVLQVRTGKEVAIQADTLFPTASMIKIPLMLTMMHKIQDGAFKYHQNLLYRDSLLIPGVDILGMAKDSSSIELSKVMMLMITESDNTAASWIQRLDGSGDTVNSLLEGLGMRFTRLNSRTPGREAAYRAYGWGQTTPREMAHLLLMIRRGEVVSPAASERMYRNLTHIYWDEVALSQIPPYVQAASKQGALDDSRSEVVLVNAPHGDYVFCIDTKHIQDQSWSHQNQAWELIRQVSSLLWNYYEPHYGWKPAPGMDHYAIE